MATWNWPPTSAVLSMRDQPRPSPGQALWVPANRRYGSGQRQTRLSADEAARPAAGSAYRPATPAQTQRPRGDTALWPKPSSKPSNATMSGSTRARMPLLGSPSFDSWMEDYNTVHPHSRLGYRS